MSGKNKPDSMSNSIQKVRPGMEETGRRLFGKIYALTLSLVLALSVLSGCQAVESDVQGPLNNLSSFTAYDRKDNPFTQEVFSDYDATILCFWAPWSDASIYELKQQVTLSEKLPERIGFISVCLDNDLKESKSRLKELNLKGFTTLMQGDGDFKAISDAIVNVPTTIIVDSQGNIIGDPIIGIQEDNESIYLDLLNKAMKETGGKKVRLEQDEDNSDKEKDETSEDKDDANYDNGNDSDGSDSEDSDIDNEEDTDSGNIGTDEEEIDGSDF